MAAPKLLGVTTWSMQRDAEGHREYKVRFEILADTTSGPATVLTTAGLPAVGDTWAISGDIDVWAWCRPGPMSIVPRINTGEPQTYWDVEMTFSTKPPDKDKVRCQDHPIEDPLLEPAKVNGASVKYTEEAVFDRFGVPILTSSWELVRGPQNEWDANRDTLTIEQNVPRFSDIAAAYALRDHLNSAPLWGLNSRCIKLGSVNFERKFYGVCSVYFTRTLTFETRVEGFDRTVLDEATKVLNGHWDNTSGHFHLDPIGGVAPNRLNPQHFKRYQDRSGNTARVMLNGFGVPAGVVLHTGTGTGVATGEIGQIPIQKYLEGDLVSLGIPVTFDVV